jgi:hypothetical protein
MIYNKYSIVGVMLWVRYALLAGRPLTSLETIYSKHLESPGTKAYTHREAKRLFPEAVNVETQSILTHGDLLTSSAGQRHRGMLLTAARRFWPRSALRRFFPSSGLLLMIQGRKSGL